MRVDFREGRILERRKHDLPETALARVGDVFGVDEKAVFAESFFAENAENTVRFSFETIAQKLTAGVIGFKTQLEIRFLFK